VRDGAWRLVNAGVDVHAVDAVLNAADGAALLAGVLRERDPASGSLEAVELDGGVVRGVPGLKLL
jgi:hypothetical protein